MAKVPFRWKKVGNAGKVEINGEDNSTFTSQSPALKVNGNVESDNITSLSNTSATHTTQISGLTSRVGTIEGVLPNGTVKATSPLSVVGGKVDGLDSGTGRLYANGAAFSNPQTANNTIWLRVSGTDTTDTTGEIAMGNTPGVLYVRQYDSSGAVAKEATLLDKSGNTVFPGEVSATKFIGNLQGNADSATTADRATTAGSATTADSATTANSATAATYLKDSNNSDKTYTRYSDSGLGLNDVTWLACWRETTTPAQGYELRKVEKTKLFNSVLLFDGTLSSGSTTFDYGYKFYIIEGDITNNASRYTSAVIPGDGLDTGVGKQYCYADESKYMTFTVGYTGTTVTLTMGTKTGAGGIRRIWGIN